jgi:hypothetical protein
MKSRWTRWPRTAFIRGRSKRQPCTTPADRHGERIQVLGTCEWNGKKLRVFIRMIDVEMGVGRVITAWEV